MTNPPKTTTETPAASTPFERRIAEARAEREAADREAAEAAEKREADHHSRISDLERQVAVLSRASKAADHDEAEEDWRAEQEDRISKLERLVDLLVKANTEKRAAIASLKNQVNALQAYLQRLRASQSIPAGRNRRRDNLDAALERELYQG